MDKLMNILDEFYDLVNMLEVCRGYTQADRPSMEALDITLNNLYNNFMSLYGRLDDEIKFMNKK
jgi:cupin superfamily acireductone dioxygenase involved in methionine salvage